MSRRRFWQRLGANASGRLAAWMLRMLGATWRLRIEGRDPRRSEPGPHIAALWHRDLLITAYVFRDRGYAVAVSRSADGDLISTALGRLGYSAPVRGSSSRGGAAALRGLVALVSNGTTVSIQVDGPRGPARRSKPGAVSLARLTGVPLAPLAMSARPCLRMSSWDGTLVPLPFAKVVCRFADPLPVRQDADPEIEAGLVARLDRILNQTSDALDAETGFLDPNSAAPVDELPG